MNFTRKSRQSTVKHEVKSKFRRFANNFCRKNTGFSVDFHFFDDKKTKKHVYFTVLTRPKRREHDKTHGFESKKLQIRTDFRFFGNKKTKKHVYFTVLDVKIPPKHEKTQVFRRFYERFANSPLHSRLL